MIVLQANERNATAQLTGRLTSGSVGIPVTVILSDDYKDLAVTLCFRAGDARADVPYKPGDTVTVPAQCLRQANLTLAIGVRAESSDGTEVIPTIYATVGMIEKGARYSGINPEPPAPSWAAQVQTWANESRDAAVSAKDYAEDVHEWVSTQERITSLNSTELVVTGKSVEALGNPVYVSDVTPYSAYGITETGWYVFARITGRSGELVTAATSVTGAAGYIATVGESHVDLAVKFGVNALAQKVVIAWGASTDVIVFKATDLAINNLDYRVTFYVYDIADFATWEYKDNTDSLFVGNEYWVADGQGGYERAAVKAYDKVPTAYFERTGTAYVLTTDATFQEGVTYYTESGGTYTAAEVTVGAAVTANTYYVLAYTYAPTSDTIFQSGKTYYTRSGAGTAASPYSYAEATVTAGGTVPTAYYTHSYVLTTDATFQEGVTYYTESGGTYTAAEVTTGEAVTANTYYVDKWEVTTNREFVGTVYFTESGGEYEQAAVVAGDQAIWYVVEYTYSLTTDATFQSGKTYYVLSGDEYVEATVTVGEAVTADTYYVRSEAYVQATGTFEDGVTYYTKSGNTYSEATVTAGAAIPAWHLHSKVTFEGMTRNITYKCDVPIDCPSVFVLPEIEDDTHGCWFEMRFRHLGSFSSTLQVPEGVKVATEHTQAESAGVNMVDLHYNSLAGIKTWRFLNTHSTIPTT